MDCNEFSVLSSDDGGDAAEKSKFVNLRAVPGYTLVGASW